LAQIQGRAVSDQAPEADEGGEHIVREALRVRVSTKMVGHLADEKHGIGAVKMVQGLTHLPSMALERQMPTVAARRIERRNR
jgi:hypothetical protein